MEANRLKGRGTAWETSNHQLIRSLENARQKLSTVFLDGLLIHAMTAELKYCVEAAAHQHLFLAIVEKKL